jgi:hypothetical protein
VPALVEAAGGVPGLVEAAGGGAGIGGGGRWSFLTKILRGGPF